MITPVVQRWSAGRASYRPIGEVIRTSDYEVELMKGDAEARSFVESNHYSASFPASRFNLALRKHDQLVGVAVFSQPINNKCLEILPGDEGVELGRFILADDVPANGESFFLGQCFQELRRIGLTGVVSHSDPVPRTSIDGAVTFTGHIGTIYQATNGVYNGRSTARTLRVMPDGRVMSARAIQKIRAGESGFNYAVQQLVNAGAAPLESFDARREWLCHWLPRVTRPLRHPGNHRYLWALNKRDRRFLPESMSYPKFTLSASNIIH